MNESLLTRMRQVRDLKAGPPHAHVPSVDPREEDVVFHFDILGQQYTAAFEQRDRNLGPYGEYNIHRAVYIGDEQRSRHAIAQSTSSVDESPVDEVTRVVKAAIHSHRDAIRTDRESNHGITSMSHNGPIEQYIDVLPIQGEEYPPDEVVFSVDVLGREFPITIRVEPDFDPVIQYLVDLPGPFDGGDFHNVQMYGDHHPYNNEDAAARALYELFGQMRRDFERLDTRQYGAFDTYE
jgi:hypothetical protein